MECALKRDAVGVTVSRMKHNIARRLQNAGRIQNVGERHARPASVSDPWTADLVTDTGQRRIHRKHTHLSKLVHVERERLFNRAVDLQFPVRTGDYRIDGILRYGIELSCGRDLFAQTGDAGEHTGAALQASG